MLDDKFILKIKIKMNPFERGRVIFSFYFCWWNVVFEGISCFKMDKLINYLCQLLGLA